MPGKIAIWVFSLVFLAVIILQSGNYTYVQDNGHSNFGPSGTSAFLELLKRSNYKVKIDDSGSPKLAPTMVIPVSNTHKKSFASFMKSIKSGTTIVTFVIPEEDRDKPVPLRIINDISGESAGQLEPLGKNTDDEEKPPISNSESVNLLSAENGGESIAKIYSKDNIRIIHMTDASCITNRHIDKVNNASISLGLISMAGKPEAELTFVGNFSSRISEDNLIAKLGRPFEAAWSQLMILVLVIFITLSIRFGLAPETRASERGGRELVDGLAWMTKRKKNARWALRAVFDRVLTELERRHRIGREQIIQRPDLYLSPDAAIILKDVEAATMHDISEQEAIRHAKALKRLV